MIHDAYDPSLPRADLRFCYKHVSWYLEGAQEERGGGLNNACLSRALCWREMIVLLLLEQLQHQLRYCESHT